MVVYIFFVMIVIGLFVISEQYSSTENAIQNKIMTDKDNILLLADSINSLLDTAYYAEYRLGKQDFVFYYLRNDSIANFFEVKSSQVHRMFKDLYSFGVRKIWKYNSENFSRYEFYINAKLRPQLLVLSQGESSFLIANDSKIKDATIVDTIKNIRQINKPTLWKMSRRCWAYYPFH